MHKILLILASFQMTSALADTTLPDPTVIDICDRGKIGEILGSMMSSRSCKNVSKQEMATTSFLTISGESIQELPDNAFAGFTSLFGLELSQDQIVHISKHAFAGLPSLRFLSLEGNLLKRTPRAALSELHLTDLDLKNNRIRGERNED